ncbi:hypothetical protein PMAYCL1PPCAC_23487 [Pristionchus mayeri]|uniref:B30.2/SPRY domain-containing protein n=1 Tax=Pristionchus mayeri TaxID=1317129 RepID=A0AAN5I5M9_9BILA|nr:hypothetical protein PMAYCL1PPCAC_23487 [Pristionchus mayeri]
MADHRLAVIDSFGPNEDQFMASTFEADMDLIDKRLKRLYPYVDFETTQVPTQWNKDDKCTFMRVSHLNLRFMYPERPGIAIPDRKNKMEPGAVRANHPCPLFAGVYYFEVHIKESDGYMGVGLCQKSVKMNRLPGWDAQSYGYHGDDGNFFSASGTGVAYGPTFGKDDVIGCGLNLVRKTVFFTKNGANLGTALEIGGSVDELYPTVGLQTPNAMVDVNFGQMPFLYDIYKDIQSVKETVSHQVEEMRMPSAKKKSWLNGYIASWLATEGHAKALKTFCEESNTEYNDIEEENVVERKNLAKLVYDKRVAELCDELDSKLKNFNDARPLALDLRTQKFAEKVLERISMPPPSTPMKNGLAKEGNGCAAHSTVAASSASSSSISSSANGNAHPSMAGNGTASAPPPTSRPRGADLLMEQGPSCSTSSSATSLRGGKGIEMNTMSPSRPHKRRSSGAKVMDGERRDSSGSRPPSSDFGPPPRRRSARGKEERRRDEDDEEMEVDIPSDSMRRVVSKGTMQIVRKDSSKNGGPSSSKNFEVTEDELALLLNKTPLKSRSRSSRSKSRSGRKKKGWKGIEIVQEGRSIAPSLKEHEEDIKLRCGYTKAEEEEANRLYEEMIREGMEINSEAKALVKKHPREFKYATVSRHLQDALYSVMCNSREEVEKNEIFGERRARCLVHSMNKGLLKLEFGHVMCESRLARLEKSVRTQKVHFMKVGCAMAPFIDIEGLMGRQSDHQLLREKKGTASFYDPNDMRMLERRRVQTEIEEKMRIARETQEIAAKAHRKKKRKLRKKERMERSNEMERGEEGDGMEKKRRWRRTEGSDRPPKLRAERGTPMEVEDGQSGSRREGNRSSQRGSNRRGRGGRSGTRGVESERLLERREGEGEGGETASHPGEGTAF